LARDRQGDGRVRADRIDRFDRITGQRLADGREAGAAQCPDASIIAAYRERRLSRDERAECERHFAQCARCGSALAALARIDDAEVAIQSEGIANTRAARSERRAWWRLRGALPLATFSAVGAILMVIVIRTFIAPRGPGGSAAQSEFQAKSLAANAGPTAAKPGVGAMLGSNDLVGNGSLLAMNEPTRAQPASSPPLQKSSAADSSGSRSVAGTLAQSEVPSPPQAGPVAREQGPGASRDELKEEESRVLELDKKVAELRLELRAAAVARAPHPPTPLVARAAPSNAPLPNGAGVAGGPALAPEVSAAPAAPAPVPPANPAGPPAAASAAPAGAPARDTSAAAGVGGAGSSAAGSTFSEMAAAVVGPMPSANAVVVEPPDHTMVWMVGAHGYLSRYSPATGWVAQSSGVTTDLTAGSAPSAATCWIVGRGGTILRTVDGEHWTSVATPVNDDLTGVIASSASSATIFAANGRRFATSDGGATWRPL
jgi:hypothetical protein